MLLLLLLVLPAAHSLALPTKLRAAAVKRRLAAFGIPAAGIFEKDELVALLQERVPEALGAGHAVPLEVLGVRADAMGAGVTADASKRYAGVRLGLSAVSDAERSKRVLWALDSAASNSLLTPAAAALLDAAGTGVTATAATATASGVAGGFKQVALGEASLADGTGCGELRPVVMELPIAAPAGGEVGLLGLDFLRRFVVDLRLRRDAPLAVFHAAADGVPDTDGLARVACPARAPAGLLVASVRLEAAGGTGGGGGGLVDAILDLGSSSTVANWAAAEAAGFRREGDARVTDSGGVIAGASGEPVRLYDADATVGFGDGGGVARRAVRLSIASLPVFEQLGFRGPALVLGLDCLAPRSASAAGSRVVLSAATGEAWI